MLQNFKKTKQVLPVTLLVLLLMILSNSKILAQSPCMATVPSYTINLTGNPAGVWSSPNVSRNDQCCTATSPDQCIYFNLTLDPNTAGIQIDMIGADPAGSLFYDINCTGSYPGGQIKCISGVGPHEITFCKPGGNKNVYKITSISKPLFPNDDTTRIGCKKKLVTLGIVNNSVTWQSIFPGIPGQYNSYLDSINVASPTYSPATGAPTYVDYKVCGFPQASGCGFSLTVCDTVRVYNYPSLTATVTPNPATFCNVGPGSGVTLTGLAGGGLPTYSYTWLNSSNTILGTGAAYTATAQGAYKLDVKDRLYNASTCPSTIISPISVSVGVVPTVDAGASQKVCASNPLTALSGTVQNASSGIWSGGSGTYNPGNTYLNTNYTPSAAEIAAGFVKIYLTSTGAGGGCVNKIDSTIIYFSSTPSVSISSGSLACNNSTTTIQATVSGGTGPYTYIWNTGVKNNSITGGQGNYSVIVYDSLNCASINTSSTVVAPTALSLNFNSTNVVPDGSSTGTASVTVNGGTPAYTVTWTPTGLNTFSLSGLPYGIYSAVVTDANGCQISGSTVVGNSLCSGLTALATSTNVNCFGGSTGTASVAVSGGAPAYTYTWNSVPAQNTATASNLKAGVYTVLVTDFNGCVQTANATISEPTLLTNVMTHTDVTVINGNNGSAAANPFGGSTPYTYLWNTSATTSSITSLFAGTYTVNITDNKGCVKTDSVKITQPPCNGLTLNVFTSNALCYGSKGSAFAIITGAKGTYTVTWSDGTIGQSVTGLAAGNYSVSVSDTANCTEFFNFTITEPSQLTLGISHTDVSCNGSQNGTIDLNISGGTFPYTFNWNSGMSTAEDLTNLKPNTYSVQVIDANGCSSIASEQITQPSVLAVSSTTQNVTCIYGTDGSIALNVTGGTIPYTYTWSTGATTQSITNLPAGGYTVSVRDANFCQIATPLIIGIGQPDSLKVDSFIVACSVPGSNQTQVTVVPTGGYSGVFQVSYNNGTTFETAGVYSAMLNNATTYSIVLKDANNCVSLKADTLTIKKEVKIDSVTFGKCYTVGTTTVPVRVYPSGGDNGPYSVSFNNGSSYLTAGTYTSNVAVASTYTVIIKDARGCISAIKTISLPAIFNATTTVTSNFNGQNISCFGLTDGAALVTTAGGSGSYTYSWTSAPSQTTAALSNVGAGTYSVTINDGNGCAITKTVVLTQPTSVTATASVTSNYNGQNISCNGLSDGTASVTAGGGTTPYTYAWNSIPSQTTAIASGLSAGTYSVVVKDVNNCPITTTVTLTQPTAITATATVTSNYNGQQVTCFGATNASITTTATNGTAPFTYSWSTTPVQTGTVVTGIGAGTYSVIVTDVNGCNITKTVTVSQPAVVAATASVTSNYNGQNISCFNLTDGSANVTPTGGTTPYTYLWTSTPSQTTAALINVGAGTYSVTVTDINGCNITKTVTLIQSAQLTSTAAITSNYNGQNISCFGLTDGSAAATVNGGTGAYSYTWSTTPAQNTANASNIGAGTYTVTIKDVNNCTITNTVTLIQPTTVTATASVTSDFNGQNISCFGYNDGSASVTAGGGTTPYTYAWNSIPTQTTTLATALTAGTYSVVVKDMNNCSVTTTVTLTQPASMSSTIAVTSNYNGQQVTCFGATDASITALAADGTAPYTYTWTTTPVQTGTLVTGIGAGTYSVVMTDINGCAITKTISVSEPTAVAAATSITSNYNGQNISCFGLADASANVIPSGGTSPYFYSWTSVPTQTTTSANNLGAGVYSVTITDVNGCNLTTSLTINQPTPIDAQVFSLSSYNGFNVNCFGSTDGNIDITVNGGTGVYTYTWSNTATTQDILNLGAGSYSVVVSDVNGCKDTLTTTLTEPTQLVVTIDSLSNYNGYQVSCFGSQNGSVYVTATGGANTYSYTWSNNSTNQDLSNVGVGLYTLLVTDQNRCTISIDTLLTAPTVLTFTSSVTDLKCYGVPTGSINTGLSGGVTPYTYTWSNTATTEDISNVSAGTYTVTYNDLNGCNNFAVLTVNQPDTLAIMKTVDNLKCNGDTLGNIFLSPNGGTSPYTYLWSDGSTTKDLVNIPSGTYSTIMTDANSCVYYDTTKITEPTPLQITLTSPVLFNGYNVSSYQGNDGSVELVVSGGISPYSYLWSNGATTQNISNLNSGNYFVTVMDTNGCRISGEITLTQPLVLEMPQGFSPNNDGKNDLFVVHGIESYPDNVLTIYNRWGNIVYSKAGYFNEWNGISNNEQQLPDATYFAILEVNKGEIVLKGYVELRR